MQQEINLIRRKFELREKYLVQKEKANADKELFL